MNNKLPVIFIFDLDKTLIGDMHNSNMLEYQDFLTFINDACKHKRFLGNECKLPKSIWNKQTIPPQFFRPQLKESFQSIKKIFPTAEFFVFSLGTNDYVSSIIEYLESYIGIKINRPLFSRQDSSFSDTASFLKEIKGYEDIMFKSLIQRYPKCKIEYFRNLVMNERTIIIDDSDVWNNDFRWIQCKTYTYAPVCEINNKLLDTIYNNDSIKKYIINKNSTIIPRMAHNIDMFKMNYHIMTADCYRRVLDNNIQQLNDDFFPKFVRAIKNRNTKLKPFSRAFLSKIQKSFV
jgi:hypothetical protein